MDVTLIIVAIITGLFSILGKIVEYLLTRHTPPEGPEKPRGSPTLKRIWKLLAIITIIIVALWLIFWIWNNMYSPVVQITFPQNNGDGVNPTLTVKGTSQNIPEGQELWVVIYVPKVNLYYPMSDPVVPKANGYWECFTSIGAPNDTGDEFTIIAVLANQTARDEINAYITKSKIAEEYEGITKLPLGAIIYDERTVIRNPPPD